MKTLIMYYSRDGTTEKIAKDIARILNCDIEMIDDNKNRKGPMGYLRSGKEAGSRQLIEIQEAKNDPSSYDMIIIGTPIWAWNISSPVRSYLEKYKDKISKKKIAFFCTMGGSGDKRAFAEMEDICKNKPIATLSLKTGEALKEDICSEKIKEFVDHF